MIWSVLLGGILKCCTSYMRCYVALRLNYSLSQHPALDFFHTLKIAAKCLYIYRKIANLYHHNTYRTMVHQLERIVAFYFTATSFIYAN